MSATENQSRRSLIIAIDPGYTTGNVIAELDPRSANGFTFVAAVELEWSNRLRFYREFFAANYARIEAIVIERFYLFGYGDSLQSQVGSEMPSSRVIGAVEAFADFFELTDRIVVQEVWAKKQLKRVDNAFFAGPLGFSKHNLDAYKHCWYYARTNRRRWLRENAVNGAYGRKKDQ